MQTHALSKNTRPTVVPSLAIFLFSLVFMAFLFINPLQAHAEAPWEGSGTEADPYLIVDAEGLRALSKDVDGGSNSLYSSNSFKLTTDVDLENEPWIPIGTYHLKQDSGSWFHYFQGSFDGGGHVISGLNVTAEHSTKQRGTENYVGLFGCVKNATLKNFIVEGEIEGGNGVSGVVGWTEGTTLIENVGNKASLKSDVNSVGGVVGAATNNSTQLTLLGCFNRGDIVVTGSNGAQVGGLVGIVQNNVRLTNCYSTGLITSSGTRVGGLYGYTANVNASIINCYSATGIKGSETYSGVGAFGGEKTPNLQNCFYDSSLTSLTGINNPNQDPDELQGKTSEEMKNSAFANELSAKTEASRKFVSQSDINDGYPVLSWEVEDTDLAASSNSTPGTMITTAFSDAGISGLLWMIMALFGILLIIWSIRKSRKKKSRYQKRR